MDISMYLIGTEELVGTLSMPTVPEMSVKLITRYGNYKMCKISSYIFDAQDELIQVVVLVEPA